MYSVFHEFIWLSVDSKHLSADIAFVNTYCQHLTSGCPNRRLIRRGQPGGYLLTKFQAATPPVERAILGGVQLSPTRRMAGAANPTPSITLPICRTGASLLLITTLSRVVSGI